MNFSEAMKSAQEGAAVSCWTPYWFVYWVEPASYPAQTGIAKTYFGDNGLVPYAGYFAQYIANDGIVSVYHPTVEELFREWHIVKIGDGVSEWMHPI